jgi:hypothetical protein
MSSEAPLPIHPWETPDPDDFETRQSAYEGAGEWADSETASVRDADGLPEDDDTRSSGPRAPRRPIGRARSRQSVPSPAGGHDGPSFLLHEELGGHRYVRTEMGWQSDQGPVTLVPLIGRLDNHLSARLRREDETEQDPTQLLRRAWFARALKQADRAELLCRRILRMRLPMPPPGRSTSGSVNTWSDIVLPAAAMLSSAARAQGHPEEALEATDAYAEDEYVPLMTSRAAAMCDLGRWEEARNLATRAMQLGASDQVHSLLERIELQYERSR